MRLTLSVALALSFLRPGGALAQGSLVKVWIEDKTPQVVWGEYSGRGAVALFDTGVPTKDRFTPAVGWRISRFSMAALSPDVRRVAFTAVGAGSRAVGIFGLQARQAEILDTSCDARTLTWSPTGRYLAVEDSQGLLNNAVRVVGYDDTASEMEISGDVLSDLGYSAYRFRNEGLSGGRDIWRTQVFSAQWDSERRLAFKVKRVHLKTSEAAAPRPEGESTTEDWAFDVVSKKFIKL